MENLTKRLRQWKSFHELEAEFFVCICVYVCVCIRANVRIGWYFSDTLGREGEIVIIIFKAQE